MTAYLKNTLQVMRERKAVTKGLSQSFFSAEDEVSPDLKRSEIRRKIQRRLKEKFPALP